MLLKCRGKRKSVIDQFKPKNRDEFRQMCIHDVERLKSNDQKEEMIIASSLILLLFQNGLGKKLGENNIFECARAGIEGWKKADEVMADNAKTGEAWDEVAFDRIITGSFVSYIHEEFHINDWNVLQTIRWAFNFGAQSRVKYQTLEAYTNMYRRGDLYDVKVKTLSKEEVQSLEKLTNGQVEKESMAEMEKFKALYFNILDSLYCPRLKELSKKEPASLALFFGGMINSGMTQGRIQIDDIAGIDEDTQGKIQKLYDHYVNEIAGEPVLEFSKKYKTESFSIFVLGLYCNQVSGEGKQIVPYDFDFTHFDDAMRGDPAAQVMVFCSKK